ncbi:MAG: PEGA domain-containing protein [Myxococcales bacterium]
MSHAPRILAVVTALLCSAPLTAAAQQARKAAIVSVALDGQSTGEAMLANAALEAALAADARVAPIRLDERARGGQADPRRAKGDEAAKALAAGGDAFDEMEFAKAVTLARQAQALLEEADLRVAMPLLLDAVALEAVALLADGKKGDARGAMGRVLALSADYKWKAGRMTPEATKALDEVRAKARALPKGVLDVRVSPVTAMVFVDGVLRGASPLVVGELPAGNHYVTAFSPGYVTAQAKGFAGPDGALSLTLEPLPEGLKAVALSQDVRDGLTRSPAAATGAAAALAKWAEADELLAVGLKSSPAGTTLVGLRADAAGKALGALSRPLSGQGEAARPDLESFVRELMAAAPPKAEASAEAQASAGTGRSSARWAAGWATLGVGVAAAGAGLGLGLNAASVAQQARQTPQTDPVTYKNLSDSAKTQGLVANISLGVGAAAAIAGVVLLVTSGSSSPAAEPQAAAVVAPVAGGAALAVAGTF